MTLKLHITLRLDNVLSWIQQDDTTWSEPVQDESMCDVNDREGSKATSGNTQHDKLYTAEGILDPRKKKAEKKRRKGNKFSVLNDMDADYDFKVDYQMKDAGVDDDEEDSKGGDETKESEPMTGVCDA
jgi:nuclear GTP-binding protein